MNDINQSIIPAEMRGVQKITGYRGKGKSYYVSTVEDPELTAFFDFEKKGEGIENQLHFGLYVPVTERASGGALGVWDVFAREIRNLPQGKFTHVILDNTAPLETAMKAEAARNADKYARQFGMNADNIRANKYGGQSGVVNYMVSEEICNPLWAKGVKLISVTSHIKPRWQGGIQVANSYNIKGADRFDELSILTLIIVNGDVPPIPSALVYKEQLGEVHYNRELKKFSRQRRLPYRLPQALPEEIARYIREPADLNHPKAGELPSESELAPFREELSREQIALVFAEVEKAKQQNLELTMLPDAKQKRAQELASEGKSKPEIAKVLAGEFAESISVAQVVGWLNGSGT